MNKDIIIFTVPHSGTSFTLKYFDVLDFKRWKTDQDRTQAIKDTNKPLYANQHSGDWLGYQLPDYERYLRNSKVVVTVRHPYNTLRSFLRRGRTFEQNMQCWKSLFEWLPKLDYCIFDIDCKEEERLPQMLNILKHVDEDTYEYREITKQYVDAWRLINVTEGRRIKQHNINITDDMLSQLSFAIEWYERFATKELCVSR